MTRLGLFTFSALFTVVLAGCDVAGPGLLGAPAEGSTAENTTVNQARVCQIPSDDDEIANQLIRLINIERFEHGAVALNEDLSGVAGNYACEMISRDFFAHEEPDTGRDVAARLSESNVLFTVAGENLAAGYWSPTEIIEGWMSSPSHRQVLMDADFTRAGIAVRYGGSYGVYCVLILADQPE